MCSQLDWLLDAEHTSRYDGRTMIDEVTQVTQVALTSVF